MRFALVLLLASVAGAADFHGVWDATIVAGGQRVPFRMEILPSPARACFFEDTDRVCSSAAAVEGDKLNAEWDFLNTELHLSLQDGVLAGIYRSRRTRREMAVEARPHQAAPAVTDPPADLDGDWEMHSRERPQMSWQLLLRQSGSDLKGTILRVDGDDGTLVGQVRGRKFSISHFSGDRALLLEGELLADGSLALQQGSTKAYALRPAEARRRNLPPPDNPDTFAHARNPSEKFHFSLPDLNGRTFTEADFAGKPLIVSIAGSWCPNCRDEAPFFAELYRSYHGAGLEIVAFCFEYTDETNYAPLRAYLRKFAIPYPALLAGEPSKLKEVVPQIENISAFPTSIYIGKDGRVRLVHTGFPSGGSGEELERVKNELRAAVERMLAEGAHAAPSGSYPR